MENNKKEDKKAWFQKFKDWHLKNKEKIRIKQEEKEQIKEEKRKAKIQHDMDSMEYDW